MVHKYLVSGLNVEASHRFPFLTDGWHEGSQNTDVVIEIFDFDHSSRPTEVVSGASFSFLAKEGLIFQIYDGRRISIYRGTHIADVDIAIYLLGSAWGALCHQRGLFPLHCSSIGFSNNAYAFIAESGGGKSTIAAGLSNLGLEHFCDDVAIVHLDSDNGAVAHPMPKGIKLWREATEALGLNTQSLVTSDSRIEKYYVDAPLGSTDTKLQLKGIYMLSFGSVQNQASIKQLSASEALMGIYRNVYRVEWLHLLGNTKRVLSQARKITDRVPVYEFTRPRNFEKFAESTDLLANHIRNLSMSEETASLVSVAK